MNDFPRSRTAWVHPGRKLLSALSVLLCIAMVIALCPFRANASDAAEELALDLYEAIQQGQTKAAITVNVPGDQLNSTLGEAFKRYPALSYYYNGYSSMGYADHTEVTFNLNHLDVPWEKLYIAHSLEDVKNIFYYSMSRFDPDFRFIMVNGPEVTVEDLSGFADQLRVEANLAFMGFYTYEWSSVESPFAPLKIYHVTFKGWDGISRSTMEQWRDAAEEQAIRLSTTLFAQDMPDYKKELLIHDWMANNCRYNTQDTSAPISHVAYSALVSGNPVCQGYAEAALILFQAAGIPIHYIVGDGLDAEGNPGAHAWNCVQIQGQWYLLDITWDDPTSQDGTDTLRYTYFNVTSAELAKDHIWEYGDFPNCTATQMSYDTVRSLVDSDTNVYTDYSDRNLMTRARVEQIYGALLKFSPVPERIEPPQSTEPDPTESTTPQYTTPGYTTPGNNDGTTPDYTTDGYTTPGHTDNSTQPSEELSGPAMFGILFGFILVIGGIISAIVIAVKRRSYGAGRDEHAVFDPSRHRY